MSWPLFTDTLITESLKTARVGRIVQVLAETGSTNDDVLAAAERDGVRADGLAIFAEFQRTGRGRQGRTWLAPRGASILCSVLLVEPDSVERAGLLTFIAGIAVCDAVREASMLWPVLRWPNDVYINGNKLAGVLVESRPLAGGLRAWAIGVGINCYQHASHFPPEIRERATSLELASPEAPDRLEVARQLLRQFDRWAVAEGFDPAVVRHAWMERAETMGQRVRLVSEGRAYSGSTLDIDPQQGLLVQLDEGSRKWFDAARTQVV